MNTLQFVLATGVALMAPILWAGLGEIVSEKAGTLNLGIEGVMAFGVLGAAYGFQRTGSPLVGVVCAIVLGLVCGLVLSGLFVYLGTDQIVTGILFSIMALGLCTVLAQQFVASPKTHSLDPVDVPGLSRLPFLGDVLFEHNLLVYGSFLAVPCVAFLLYKTWFGLHVRAAGYRPLVVETAGVRVRRVRSVALTFACVMAAIGGATLTLSTASIFQPDITAGRGYIALVVVVLARWNPAGAVAAGLLFGVAQALQFQADNIPGLAHVPFDVIQMVPYLAATLAVVVFRGSRYPVSVGLPFRPAGRT